MTVIDRRTRALKVDGMGTVNINEMNGRAFVEWQQAQAENKSPMVVAAIVIKHCVDMFKDESIDAMLEQMTPTQLTALFTAIIELSDIEGKNSGAGRKRVSSVN